MMRAGSRHALHALFGVTALSGVARAESLVAPSAQPPPVVVESAVPSAVVSPLPSVDWIGATSVPGGQPSSTPGAEPSEPRVQSLGPAAPTATPHDRGTRADSSDGQDLARRRYLLAFGGALSTGPAGLTGGFGTIVEGYVRANVLPPLGLGLGVSYLDLSVSNTDNYPPVHAQALELNASWHPLKHSFDPFLQLGELRLFNVSGNVFRPPSPWSTEGRVGVNLVVPHFAIGLQVRSGFAHFDWLMVGLQLEGRI